jgi:hypothetical protein
MQKDINYNNLIKEHLLNEANKEVINRCLQDVMLERLSKHKPNLNEEQLLDFIQLNSKTYLNKDKNEIWFYYENKKEVNHLAGYNFVTKKVLKILG